MKNATPAPWQIDGDRGVIHGTAPGDNGELPICQLLHDHTCNVDADRGAADGQLMIAAPVMLAALKKIIAINGSTGGHKAMVAEFKNIALLALAGIEGATS